MIELLKRLHLKVERFFEERKREATLGRALVLWLLVSVFLVFWASLSLLSVPFARFDWFLVLIGFSIPILLESVAYFLLGRLAGWKHLFAEFLYVNSFVKAFFVVFGVSGFGYFSFVKSVAVFVLTVYFSIVMVKQLSKSSYLKSAALAVVGLLLFLILRGYFVQQLDYSLLFFSPLTVEENGFYRIDYGSFNCSINKINGWTIASPNQLASVLGREDSSTQDRRTGFFKDENNFFFLLNVVQNDNSVARVKAFCSGEVETLESTLVCRRDIFVYGSIQNNTYFSAAYKGSEEELSYLMSGFKCS